MTTGDPDAPVTPSKRFKARYIVLAVVCAGAVVWMITSLATNIDYWMPVKQAVAERSGDHGKHLRVGGLVVPGTVHGRDFELSDGNATLAVHLGPADAPQTLKGCTPLVVAGRWQGKVLEADGLTRRHGSDYSSKAHQLGDDTRMASCRQPGA